MKKIKIDNKSFNLLKKSKRCCPVWINSTLLVNPLDWKRMKGKKYRGGNCSTVRVGKEYFINNELSAVLTQNSPYSFLLKGAK